MNRAAVLDTNLLLLHLTAKVDPGLLRTYKRVSQFELADIVLLERTLQRFSAFFTTPHVLAEVSNFLDQCPPHRRMELTDAFKDFVADTEEKFTIAAQLCSRHEFPLLGLSDTGLSELSSQSTVITTDFRLAGKIQATGGSVINFEHLRSAALLS